MAELVGAHMQSPQSSFAIVIPTLNAGDYVEAQMTALATQTVQPGRVLVLDSESTDDTPALYRKWGVEAQTIRRAEFDHGGTRQVGVRLLGDTDIIVFLTQDAIPARADALAVLLSGFDDPAVGLAFGRQMPRVEAGLIESHARAFSYPAASRVVRHADASRLGARAAFCSNSFAAYRRVALEAVGGFPTPIIMGEDQVVAARMLKAGWDVAYVAEAQVTHSHAYTIEQDFRRYFDTGVYRTDFQSSFADLGALGGEGRAFLRSEVGLIARRNPAALPEVAVRTAAKLLAYKLGRQYRQLPPWLRTAAAMHKGFFDRRDR